MDISRYIDDAVNIVIILGAISPVIIQGMKALGQYTHNKKIINLSSRAEIIVNALNNEHQLSNIDKKNRAMAKLSEYASEVGIKVTGDQIDDYIEAAVQVLKNLDNDYASNSEIGFKDK